MAKFFGALFLLAAVVFLYKAGVLVPDLASAFGGLRYSYDPNYIPADSMNTNYNSASYYNGYQQNYYPNPTPRYEYVMPTVYSGARPSICYTSHMPIVNGVNYNYPIICNDPPSYSVPGQSYPAPAVYPTNYPAPSYPTYPTNYYPQTPQTGGGGRACY